MLLLILIYISFAMDYMVFNISFLWVVFFFFSKYIGALLCVLVHRTARTTGTGSFVVVVFFFVSFSLSQLALFSIGAFSAKHAILLYYNLVYVYTCIQCMYYVAMPMYVYIVHDMAHWHKSKCIYIYTHFWIKCIKWK